MTARDLKRQLRRDLLAARARRVGEPDADAKAQRVGLAIGDRFLTQFEPPSGAVVSAFWPMPGELDLRGLLESLHARGCLCALPVVAGPRRPLTFRLWDPAATLVVSAWGIAEPGDECPVVTPDISIVPLLAFDRDGYRLGYGGGFYDRTLERLRGASRPGGAAFLAVGAAAAGSQVDTLPREPFDQALDWVVTEERAIPFGALHTRR